MTTALDSTTERVREAFAKQPSKMTIQLARELGLPEVEVIRALPDGRAVELEAGRWEAILREFEALGMVHVIASNNAVTIEAFGQFGNFSTWHDYFNVQTKSLDMHIRYKELTAIFAVQKPSHMDSVPTLSFQFFDSRGNSAFKVFLTFGGKAPSDDVKAKFESIRDAFRL